MKRPVFQLIIAIVVIVLALWIYLPVLTKYRELKIQEEQMDRQITDLDTKIKALQEEKDLLKNDVRYLEKVIRDELGLVKPGETVYKFVSEEEIRAQRQEQPAAPVYPAAEETN